MVIAVACIGSMPIQASQKNFEQAISNINIQMDLFYQGVNGLDMKSFTPEQNRDFQQPLDSIKKIYNRTSASIN